MRMKKTTAALALLLAAALIACCVFGAKWSGTGKELDKANENVKLLEGKVAEITAEKDGLAEKLAAAEGEKASLSSKIEELTGEAATLSDQIESLTGKVSAGEEEATSLKNEIASLETRLADITAEKDGLAEKLTAAEGEKVSLSSQIEALTAEAEALKGEIASLNEQIGSLASNSGKAALPAVGDVVNGFKALAVRDFPLIGGKLVYFEHVKTGAKLLYAANSDTNRAFDLTFLTRPIDDTGLPHVFEHATLSGSDKYPSAALFMNMSAQTYNTFMNAYTMDAITTFPVASLSEEQLLALADVYTDACFHPMVMTEESIYRTEAWRYEMADADSPLTYNGTVYSEMTGALTLDRAAMDNANRVTFPGAALSYNYGGIPDAIPQMTWESLKAYHDRFYHPSNCLVLLYGSFEDYTPFLELMDNEFKNYEKRDFTWSDDAYVRIAEPQTAEFPYPMAAGTDPADQACVYYYVLCPGLRDDPAAEQAVDHLCSLLGVPGSPLMQKIRDEFPSFGASVGSEVAGPDDAVCFALTNANRGDAERFRQIVEEAVAQVASEGFDAALVEGYSASANMDARMLLEDGSVVDSLLLNMAYDYAVTGNAFAYADYVDALAAIPEENGRGVYAELAEKWLAKPALYTLVTTYPEPGAKEEHDAQVAQKLAEIKAGMTDEEIASVVSGTAAGVEKADTARMLAQIKKVNASTLPVEARKYASTDSVGEDGVRRLNVTAAVDGVCYTGLYFDAAALLQEDIHWMRLFTRLLGKLDTDTHTREELDVLLTRYMYNGVFGVGVEGSGDWYRPYAVAEWYAMEDDLAAGYDLAEEILFHTKFTDAEKLSARITAQKTDVRNQINNSPYNALLYRQLGVHNERWQYYAYLNYLEYYEFLEKVEAMAAEDPAQVAQKLESVQQFFHSRYGAISAFAGDSTGMEKNAALADAFWAKLDGAPREDVKYSLPVPAKREALVVTSNIQFNLAFAPYSAVGTDSDGLASVACGVAADRILVPVLRDGMGVYTPFCEEIDGSGIYLLSYRDPNVSETFDVYAKLGDDLEKLDLSQDDVDGYIMNAFSARAKQPGELKGAVSEIGRIISRIEDGTDVKILSDIKSATPETVKECAEWLRKLWANGVYGTAGGIGAINENAGLYDAILNPFHVEDTSGAELADLKEDHPYYTAVSAFAGDGLMTPRSRDSFGIDEKATVGDIAEVLYVLFGGAPGAPEEGLEVLQANNIISAELKVDDELTFGLNDKIMGTVCPLAQIEYTPAATDETRDKAMTRGELAQSLYDAFWVEE